LSNQSLAALGRVRHAGWRERKKKSKADRAQKFKLKPQGRGTRASLIQPQHLVDITSGRMGKKGSRSSRGGKGTTKWGEGNSLPTSTRWGGWKNLNSPGVPSTGHASGRKKHGKTSESNKREGTRQWGKKGRKEEVETLGKRKGKNCGFIQKKEKRGAMKERGGGGQQKKKRHARGEETWEMWRNKRAEITKNGDAGWV